MHLIDPPKRLSESLVWHLQRTFYGDQGIEAWSHSHVPQSVTTSPTITRAYARIVEAYLRDTRSERDPSQPVYVIELGAGSGRFAYRFLKALQTDTRIRYLMTDASPTVVEFWRTNPQLQPFVQRGVLDFAQFDVTHPASIAQLEGQRNPVILLGNYIFDSIPQDAYTIAHGQLYANLVAISASEPQLDLTAPDSRVRISITFEPEDRPTPLEEEPDPIIRDILRSYAERLNDTSILLPRVAMACVRFFHDFGKGRALCLIADFGDTREDELEGHGPPGFGAGGGFWLPVNFHALGEYTGALGGHARHPRNRHLTLNISMFRFGASPQTDQAYSDAIDDLSPDTTAIVNRALGDHIASLEANVILALLRNTGWDPDYLHRAIPVLLEKLPSADARIRAEFYEGLQQVWEQYYPIGETDDLPFGIGVLLYSLERYTEALAFFERSLRDFGEDPRTTLNLALTLYRLGRLSETITWLDRTLELDPSNELATQMRPDVAADLAAQS